MTEEAAGSEKVFGFEEANVKKDTVEENSVKENALKESTMQESITAKSEEKSEFSAENVDAQPGIQESTASKEEVPEVSCSTSKPITFDPNKAPEDMTVAELQAAILAKMANNGPVTDQMKKTVDDNIWHDSLVNWLKSFR